MDYSVHCVATDVNAQQTDTNPADYGKIRSMSEEFAVRIHVEQVEDGSYLATSDELPGLVAQGRTIQETIEIAQDVAKKLMESYREHGDPIPDGLRRFRKSLDIDVAVSA